MKGNLGLAANRLLNYINEQLAFCRKHHPVDGFFRFQVYVCMHVFMLPKINCAIIMFAIQLV